jgi:hypothetical protein
MVYELAYSIYTVGRGFNGPKIGPLLRKKFIFKKNWASTYSSSGVVFSGQNWYLG